MISKYPEEDTWTLVDKDHESQHYGRNFHLHFEDLCSEEIKDVVKSYVWGNYVTRNRTLNNLCNVLKSFKWFNRYAIQAKIQSLREITNFNICRFISFLNTSMSEKTGKKLSYGSRKIALDSIKSIIYWCQIHKPDSVPDVEIFTGNEFVGVNRRLKIDFIPDEVLMQINEALKTEENPYLKYGIIILESTGMRIGDLLNLKIDCINPHLISGYTITWFDHKNRKQHKPMPVRTECVEAVKLLAEVTNELRKDCDEKLKDFLFIHRVSKGKKIGQLMKPNNLSFFNWFNGFTKRNNILNSDGKPYHLTSHQFRRTCTLGTDMLSKGINLNVIQEILGHSSPETTKRFYATVKDKERAEIFKEIGVIGNINQLDISHFENETERLWFDEHKQDKAALCDGYCTKPICDG